MVSLVGHNRASTLNSVSAAFDLKWSHAHLRKPSKDTSKGPFYNLLCSCPSAFHTPSYRDNGKHPHNTKNTGFHLDSALHRQGSIESRRLWLTHQLWNLFQNLLISWQEWAIASEKMQSSESLPDSQTQVKPNCLHWGWARTLLLPSITPNLMNDELKLAKHGPTKERLLETDFWSNSLEIFIWHG